MDREFWLARWEEGRTGFHRGEVHPDLRAWMDRWLGEDHLRVLVPLCGKTVDIPFLAGRGHEVVGVELSPRAVREFHQEQRLHPFVDQEDGYAVHTSPGITIYCGDLFEVSTELAGTFDRVWDRAALVAMDVARRPAYVDCLRRLLRPGGRVLLNSYTYDQARMEGPPWSVARDEVEALWAGCVVEVLQEHEAIDEVRFRELGFESWLVTTYLVTTPG